MKRFVFRLARLERLRQLRRSEARAALATAAAEAASCHRLVDAARAALVAAAELELSGRLATSPVALKQLAAWRESLRLRLEGAARLAAEAELRVLEASSKHVEAARDHRIIERLGEKRHRRWLQDIETEERRFLDETHLLRIVREGGTRSPFAAGDAPHSPDRGT